MPLVHCFTSQAPKEIYNKKNPCTTCEKLRKDKKKLQRKVKTMENKGEELNQKIIANQSEWAKTFHQLSQSPVKLKLSKSAGRTDYQ